MSSVIALEQVHFRDPVAGPKGRTCNSIHDKEVTELGLDGDMVYWERNGKRVYTPVNNVRYFIASET